MLGDSPALMDSKVRRVQPKKVSRYGIFSTIKYRIKIASET
jgi:hypothetical protein